MQPVRSSTAPWYPVSPTADDDGAADIMGADLAIGADLATSGEEDTPSDLATSPLLRWRARLRDLRAPARRARMFAAGVAAAFLGLVLYQLLFPGPRPLTSHDVNDSIAHALASVTPGPAFSEQVYQVIQP